MGTILIASGNPHKYEEIIRILRERGVEGIELVRPGDLERGSPPPDPVEDGTTYLENARIKAEAFSRWSGLTALADDSGLEVDALDGAPGLHSARYAGEDVDFDANIAKVLTELDRSGSEDRRGRFICVLALCRGDELLFSTEGTCPGTVLDAPRGEDGFGYDPIFRPEGESRTFAEMTQSEKDGRSHRGRALEAFADHWRRGGPTAGSSPDAPVRGASPSGGPSPR